MNKSASWGRIGEFITSILYFWLIHLEEIVPNLSHDHTYCCATQRRKAVFKSLKGDAGTRMLCFKKNPPLVLVPCMK